MYEPLRSALTVLQFTVTNPNDVDDFYHHLHEKLASGSFQISLEATLLGPANTGSDPFSKLSNELIREISDLLPYHTLRSLRRASRPFYYDTLSNTFWKSRLARDMPWLWDLPPLGGPSTAQIDYMKLYAWLEYWTIPNFGVQPPFLAMTNRRRIWQPCMELARHYKEVKRPQYATEPEPAIAEQAQLRTLFKVAPLEVPGRGHDEQRTRLSTRSVIWLYSWADLEKCRFGGFLIESFWNDDDHLVGLGVVFGNNRRILGAETGEKDAARIAGNDWFTKLTVSIREEETSPDGSVGISGICVSYPMPQQGDKFWTGGRTNRYQLHVRSGGEIRIGRGGLYEDIRLLCASKDKFIVGVEGHIRPVGVGGLTMWTRLIRHHIGWCYIANRHPRGTNP